LAASAATVKEVYGMLIGDENTNNILRQSDWAGFLKKRGRINKTWTTRLFVLRGPLLTYYEAEEHPTIKVLVRKGAVSVLSVTIVRVGDAGDGGGGERSSAAAAAAAGSSLQLELVLKDEGRRLLLEFPDVPSLDKWQEKLVDASKSNSLTTDDQATIMVSFYKHVYHYCCVLSSFYSIYFLLSNESVCADLIDIEKMFHFVFVFF
jgi:hypothetical protein